MKECNECARNNCDIVRSTFPKFREYHKKLSPGELRSSCHRAMTPKPWRVPLIETALRRNPQGVYDVLNHFKRRVQNYV